MADTTKFHKDTRIVRYLQKIGFYPPTFVTFLERVQSHVQNNGCHHPLLTVYIDSLAARGDLATDEIEHFMFILFGAIGLLFPERLALDRNSEFYFNRKLRLEQIIAQRLEEFQFTREKYDKMEAFVWHWCRNQTPFRSTGQLIKAWARFIKSNGEFDQFDLQFFGDLSYLIMQGPHCALFAVHEYRSDHRKSIACCSPQKSFHTKVE